MGNDKSDQTVDDFPFSVFRFFAASHLNPFVVSMSCKIPVSAYNYLGLLSAGLASDLRKN